MEPVRRRDNYSIQRILPKHYAIIELAAAGLSYTEIAKTLDISTEKVRYVLRSPLVQDELARRASTRRVEEMVRLDREAIIGKARAVLEQACEKAAEVQVRLLEADDQAVQLKASNSILDRIFGRSEGPTVVNITADQVQLLNLALKEISNGNEREVRNSERPADGETANPSEGGQEDVCERSAVPSGSD